MAPILIFIGLEITAQAFVASPPRHAAAVAISFIPAVAALVLIQGGILLAGVGKAPADLAGAARVGWDGLLVLGNGFIVTALLWGSAVVAIVERRLAVAAARLRGREPGGAGRRHPLAAAQRRAVLAGGDRDGGRAASGGRLRSRGGGAALARRPPRPRGDPGARLAAQDLEHLAIAGELELLDAERLRARRRSSASMRATSA